MTDSDAVAIAQEFRAACDEDILSVLSVQSQKKRIELERLFFYAVPTAWMRKAWPLLGANNNNSSSKQHAPPPAVVGDMNQALANIGRVEVASLLLLDHAVSDEEDEDRQKHNKSLVLDELKQQCAFNARAGEEEGSTSSLAGVHHRKPEKLRPGLEHGSDFVLLGPSAWRMVKHKFGYDHEAKNPCDFFETSAGTTLAVVLDNKAAAAADDNTQKDSSTSSYYQPIPPEGYFDYEEIVLSSSSKTTRRETGALVDVSDDETDLYAMQDVGEGDMSESPEQAHTSNDKVWLLPSSTTDIFQPDESSSHNDAVVESRAVLRRYGSGLGNLGNTCFMNSSLQCLAHTDPLRKYFLSGQYEQDLNTDNPLGTGGDLATQFARLLSEMWRTSSTRTGSSFQRTSIYSSGDPQSSTNVVYPRDFKYTLGKHAEQFMGYDQHDSQELATYLLDALHEDTNRVTQKPYVEKPEQAEEETDEEAADKAWNLHLKRENSYIMENFMAQVKSRVKCCEPECGRVSTTFDPIMFLSVPIPGSSERSLKIIFVPLNPKEGPKSFSVTVNKLASMDDLLKKVQERIEASDLTGEGRSVPLEDLVMCDVWQHDVHSWLSSTRDVSVIRDTDDTVVYELSPLEQIREIEEKAIADANDSVDESLLGLRAPAPRPKRYQLDVAELARLNSTEQWASELNKYIRSFYSYSYAFDPAKGTSEERARYYKQLLTFIDLCYKEYENDSSESPGQKRGREDSDGVANETASNVMIVSPSDPPIRGIEDRCDAQKTFENVKSLYHVTVLAFLAKKVRAEIIRLEKNKKGHTPDGVMIEVRMRKSGSPSSIRDQRIANPLVLRIPSTMTVYDLREELARRLERSIQTDKAETSGLVGAERIEDGEVVQGSPINGNADSAFGSPALLVMRQVPLSFHRKGPGARGHLSGGKQLGSLAKPDFYSFDGTKPISLASPTDEEEKELVAQLVGEHGNVYLEWPPELLERNFDARKFEAVDDADALLPSKKDDGVVTILDCIDKFCQMEQLEESEMWYCNRCKQHVRAWKQFHLYRSPPILLIHLKRFHYSARSHRRDKINTFIDFPLKDLDLTDHVLSWKEEEKPIYDCYAVSNHYGGLGGGHYTAYALNDDGEWCYYDDSRISTAVDPKEVVSDAAYVLYYRRRDVPVGEEFVMKSQTPGSPAPALIQVERGRDHDASEVSSSAAMVGDDMDIVDTDDVSSRATSPMGSVDCDRLVFDADSDIDEAENDDLPLQ